MIIITEKKLEHLISNVNYSLLDKDKKVLEDISSICYSKVTYENIPKEVIFIKARYSLQYINYSLEDIDIWFGLLNNLGFPISVESDKEFVYLIIDLREMISKNHFNSTIMFTRTIIEKYIWNVINIAKEKENYPNITFEQFTDCFNILLQKHCSTNYNHIPMGMYYKKCCDRDTLFNRFKNESRTAYDKKVKNIENSWAP